MNEQHPLIPREWITWATQPPISGDDRVVVIAPGRAIRDGEPLEVSFDLPWASDLPVNATWHTGRRHGWHPAKPAGWRP